MFNEVKLMPVHRHLYFDGNLNLPSALGGGGVALASGSPVGGGVCFMAGGGPAGGGPVGGGP